MLAVLAATTTSFAPAAQGWNYGTATFYGGRDGSGTMGKQVVATTNSSNCMRAAGPRGARDACIYDAHVV